ncbi:MAG: hypothetical protein KJP09_03710 [Bacteroidia bacterium]|nr:hypothetical protein [Bacteroidia bacterium]NNK28853.1 hypothetical protein [Flavobacteriaceae bacterium]
MTIFSEDFETAIGPQNQAAPYLGWQTGEFTTSTNNNYWWIFDNTRCNVISGNYSMAVSENMPDTSGVLPKYKRNVAASTLVYYTTPIDATNYTSITLDFNWICLGEVGFDFGNVIYSLDGNTWSSLPDTYVNQSTTQTVTNLDLSAVDGQQFYLGFSWENDNSVSGNPGFIVDDIVVKGTLLPPCTSPNQPTALGLTPNEDTIYGTFNPAAPAPTNYLVLVSTSPIAPTPASGTSYAIGDTIGTGTVVDIDSDTTFTATGLNPSTLYYLYVYSYNAGCLGQPLYNVISPLTGNATTTVSSYCVPLTITSASVKYINDVEFIGTLNDVSNNGNGYSSSPSGYQDFTGLTNSVQSQGEGMNVYVGSSTGRGHYKAWVDWNKDGTFNDVTEKVYDSGSILTTTTTFGFVIPPTQAIGDYRIRIRFHNQIHNNGTELGSYNFTPCEIFSSSGPRNDYGEAEDYLFTVIQNCEAKITTIVDGQTCGEGPADLKVTGSTGTAQYHWYDSETGGNLLATTNSGTWSPYLTDTTTFWVTADNGSCESLQRTKIIGFLNPITELTVLPEDPLVCGDNDVIELIATGNTEVTYLIDEDFESGGLGSFTQNNIEINGAPYDGISQWQIQSSVHIPSQQVWFPSISSGFGTDNFALSNADSGIVHTENELVSAVVDASTFTDLTLELDMYFSRYVVGVPEFVSIEVSTNGGASWPNVIDYITDDVGYGTAFSHLTYDLSAFIGQSNLRVRIYYYSEWGDGVAVDDIQLYGTKPLNPSFTWTGTVDAYTDPGATIPYVPGTPTSTVYIKPTAVQILQPSFSFTANATLSNGCVINKDITITNKTKSWTGANSTDWSDPNNWLPLGIPDANTCVVIPAQVIITGTDYDAYAKNLNVLATGDLELQSSNNLILTEWIGIDSNGIFNIRDGASLVQINDDANFGIVNLDRDSQPMYRYDYTFWSSPMTLASGFNLIDLSPNTPAGSFLSWQPTLAGGAGNWSSENEATTAMAPGKGYIIRAPNTFSTNPSTTSIFNATFVGTPNNGDISMPVSIGTDANVGTSVGGSVITADADQWNLLGNPYPSAIDVVSFLNHANNTPLLDGTIYLWTHNSPPSSANPDPFYGDYVENYTPNDYATVNSLGSTNTAATGGQSPTQYISSGQSFFVMGLGNGNALFNNGMRVKNDNDNFFRNVVSTASPSRTVDFEKHRFWLNLSNENGAFSQILIGYAEDATEDWDRGLDGKAFGGNDVSFYSIIPTDNLRIHARPLPFDGNDQITLGFKAVVSGTYRIGIDHLDNFFNAQDIVLKDNELNIFHNLKMAPYYFNSNIGTFNERFEIMYSDPSVTNEQTLSAEEELTIKNSVKVISNNEITVVSTNKTINAIVAYDILGRQLQYLENIKTRQVHLNQIEKSNRIILLKITLEDNVVVTKKVEY